MSAIFLSASVPEPTREDTRFRDGKPAQIRDAVVELCRLAFAHDVRLIFGGHPAISPLVLHAVRRFTGSAIPRVVIFMSEYHLQNLQPAVRQLTEWSYGDLIKTGLQYRGGVPDEALSLKLMRERMIQEPDIVGAIFIGGMEGVIAEADLLESQLSTVKRFALGSTGSAAAELATRGSDYGGAKATRTLLDTSPSYPLVMQRIFEELRLV